MAKGEKASGSRAGSSETCGGCGAEVAPAPTGQAPTSVLAVMHKDDVPEGATTIDNPDTNSDFVGVVVCLACHRDPAHRSKSPLKAHFFERVGNTPKVALMMAGSSDING